MNTQFSDGVAKRTCPLQAYLSTASLLVAETVAQSGFESVVIDLQHGEADYDRAYVLLGALLARNTTPMVRVPWNDPAIIMRVLDAGALGVICPLVNSRAEAERFVGACRYPPAGYRSVGPVRSVAGTTDGPLADTNRVVQAIAQIETLAAIDRIDEIVSTPGLSGLFPGPTDLSVSAGGLVGKVDYDDPEVVERLRHIVGAAHRAGIHVGLPAVKTEWISVLREIGVDWIQIGVDVAWIAASAAETLRDARSAVAATG